MISIRVFKHRWVCILICLLVIICVAAVTIAPNVDLPDTALKSFRVAYALVACLSLIGLLWLLALFNPSVSASSHSIPNIDPNFVPICSIEFICAFLC